MKIQAEEIQRRLRAFADTCRRKGLKATHQRTEIYREVARTPEHPDAGTIYERVKNRIPAISLDTVYRTLRFLEDEGVISRVGIAGDRTRFDANMTDHAHFICTQCGTMSDIQDVALDGIRRTAALGAVGSVDSVHVELRGTCANCG